MRSVIFSVAAVALLSGSLAFADWEREISFQGAPGWDSRPGFTGICDGPVVADVIPDWPGKEIIQAKRAGIVVIRADNSEFHNYVIPEIEPDPWQHPAVHEIIGGEPAVADLDNDGIGEIYFGITARLGDRVDYVFYSTVLCLEWNPDFSDFTPWPFRIPDPVWTPPNPTYLGTPIIARTAMTDGDPTVIFYGPETYSTDNEDCVTNVVYSIAAIDYREFDAPEMSEATAFDLVGEDIGHCNEFSWISQTGIFAQAADFDADGYDELMVRSHTRLSLFDYTASWERIPTFGTEGIFDLDSYLEGYYFASGSATIADVDADNELEILVAVTSDAGAGRLLQIGPSGTVERQYMGWPNENEWAILHTQIGVADLSGEFQGQFEGSLYPIIQSDHYLHMLNPATGQEVPVNGWPQSRIVDVRNFGSPAYADVLGMGRTQIIDPTIGYFNNGQGSVGTNELVIYDPTDPNDPVLYDYASLENEDDFVDDKRASSMPAVVDVDEDGAVDIITCYRKSDSDLLITLHRMGTRHNPELVEWQQVGNGPKHTGLYAQPVTGEAPQLENRWSGRIIVHGQYIVPVGESLTIEPGTVVEFRPDAYLTINGTLDAQGKTGDSIYFKADGTTDWRGIYLINPTSVIMDKCVIHGASDGIYVQGPPSIAIRHCRIYDMGFAGIEAYDARANFLTCEDNDISNCMYGLYGTLSGGTYLGNVVHNCSRAGIYWYGDRAADASRPRFERNGIYSNGLGAGAIAGGAFNNTKAWLECNHFHDNSVNQVLCENRADIVMNAGYLYAAMNTLQRESTNLWCSLCQPPCTCVWPPLGYAPLMKISRSFPQLYYGYNIFRFEFAGTYLFDPSQRCVLVNQHNVKNNYFESNGQADLIGPGPGVLTYCPYTAFIGPAPLAEASECLAPGLGGNGASSQLFKDATLHETTGNLVTAHEQFSELLQLYPDSIESVWATRDLLRTGLADEEPATQQHDSLRAIWLDETLPLELRQAGRREAVWALIAAEEYGMARYELEPIAQVEGDADSLWAVITLELVAMLEDGGPGIMSAGDAQPMQARLTTFHDRLHQLMGRATDTEALAQAALPQKHDLAEAYPNPFNSTVTIRFEVPDAGDARIEIFNLLGQKVAMLVNERFDTGTYTKQWNASDVPSGVYFYRFTTTQHVETHKLLLLK